MENAKTEPEKVNTHIVVGEAQETPAGFLGRWARCNNSCRSNMKENLLLMLLLLSVLAGCGVGFAVRSAGKMSKRETMYLQFPGEMLMRMLRMLILPLIVSSLISGIAGLDAKTCGRMGLRTMAYFATTTIIAVILGIIMAVTIKPGYNASRDKMARYGSAQRVNSIDTFLDLIRNLFPDNLISACYTAFRTEEVKVGTKNVTSFSTALITSSNSTNSSLTTTASSMVYEVLSANASALNQTNGTLQSFHQETIVLYEPKPGSTGQMNVLGLVVFSICMGTIIGRMEHRGKPLLEFCQCVNEAVMKLFVFFIWYSPIGITFLIAGKIVEMEDFGVLMGQVGLYFITVLCGLFIHGSIVLPLIFFVCTRQNPYRFMYGISQAMATAFGTSSSSATLPVTLHCLEINNYVDPRVSSFVIPVGATINMDGTALYEAVAALFIAQVNNLTMDFGDIVTISITATAASIGAAGVPQAGLVTMVIVLSAVGLPVDDITLILVVDWFLDRFRTMTNVTGDSLGAGIVYHFSKSELPPLPHEVHEMAEGNPDKHGNVPNGTEGSSITAV